MSDLDDLYQEIILDHYKKPRNAGLIEPPTCFAHGDNPLCGDKIAVSVKLENDRIADLRWRGAGCAISTASASLMTEAVKGKTRAEVGELFARFHDLVTGKPSAGDGDDLGKLKAFAGVSEFPMRVKCASLAWHTLRAAFEDQEQSVSTE